jgi:membrane protein implicated in regulation of membrane protease activity
MVAHFHWVIGQNNWALAGATHQITAPHSFRSLTALMSKFTVLQLGGIACVLLLLALAIGLWSEKLQILILGIDSIFLYFIWMKFLDEGHKDQ